MTEKSRERRLSELGLTLPEAMAPVATYVPFLVVGDMLYISGQLAKAHDGSMICGQLGGELSVEQGQQAARLCGLSIMAQVIAAVGSLERIKQIVRLTGFVNSATGFGEQPQVINGASDLMVDVLGDAGRHTRSAVGVSGLPLGSAVEIDAIVQLTPQ